MLQLKQVCEDTREERAKLEAEELKKVMTEIVEPFIEKLAEKYKKVHLASRKEAGSIDSKPEKLELSNVHYSSTIEAVMCNIQSAGWHFKREGDVITVWWYKIIE